MTTAMTTREVAQRLCKERGLVAEPETRRQEKGDRFRLTVDDLNIIRTLGERTLDGWDMELGDDDATA